MWMNHSKITLKKQEEKNTYSIVYSKSFYLYEVQNRVIKAMELVVRNWLLCRGKVVGD